MDTSPMTVGEIAGLLGISPPAVRRVADRLGVEAARTDGGHRRFSAAAVARLTAEVGVIPRVAGLSRVSVQVLAALASHPLGFVSARAASRAASVSPTAAGRALADLVASGLAELRDEVVVDGGSAQSGQRWRLRVAEPWLRIAATVDQAVLPAPRPRAETTRVPRRFWHLFWNAEPARLDVERDGRFIATRMVLSPNLAANAWALANLSEDALRHAARNRGADSPTRAMVHNALAS